MCTVRGGEFVENGVLGGRSYTGVTYTGSVWLIDVACSASK